MRTSDVVLGEIYTNGRTEREVIGMNAAESLVTWCPVIVERNAQGEYVSRAMILSQVGTWDTATFAGWAKAKLEKAVPAGSHA